MISSEKNMRRRSSRKRQTRISFGPGVSTSTTTSTSAAAGTVNSGNGDVASGDLTTYTRKSRRKRRKISDDDEDEEEEDDVAMSEPDSGSGSDSDTSDVGDGRGNGNVKAEQQQRKGRARVKMETPKKQATLWIDGGEGDGSAKERARYGLRDGRRFRGMSRYEGEKGGDHNEGYRDSSSSEDPLTAPTSSASISQPKSERSSGDHRNRYSSVLAERNFDNSVLKTVKMSSRTKSGNKPVTGTGLFKRKGVPRLSAELTNDSSDDGSEVDGDKDYEVKEETKFNDDDGGEGDVRSEEHEEREEEEDNDESDEVIISSSRRKKTRKTRINISSISSGEESSINLRKRRQHRRLLSSDGSRAAGKFADIGTKELDQEQAEEDEDLDDEDLDDEDLDDEEEDFPVSRKRTSVGRKAACSDLRKVERDEMEHEEIQEDLEDLQSSLPQLTTPLRGLSTLNPKQNARRKALELLKQRRAGEGTSDTVDIDEQLSHGEKDSIIDGSVSNDPEDIDSVAGSTYPTARDMFGKDEYDEEFLDDDGAENETDTIGVPLEFSKVRYYKAKDMFKYAVEWMIQKKINPGFAMNDEIYHLTFTRLKDEAIGLGSSTYTSSAWTASFKHALEARPEIEYHEIAKIDRFGLDKCDACNRSGHPATWQVRFTGNVYDKETLEEIEGDEDEDDEDDEDDEVEGNEEIGQGYEKQVYDKKGYLIPPASTVFNLGRFCMQNARMAHALAHWRYHLNDWTIDYLESEGYLSPDKIVERDSWSTRKRSEYANKIVDEMEANGEIKRLYRDYRNEISTARTSKQFVLDGLGD